MEKKIDKKIIIGVVAILAVIGILVAMVISSNNKFEEKLAQSELSVTRKSALMGTIVKVELTDIGKEKYPDAVKYTTFDTNGEATSPMAKLGIETTVLDEVKSKKSIIVKLYDENENELGQIEGLVQ